MVATTADIYNAALGFDLLIHELIEMPLTHAQS